MTGLEGSGESLVRGVGLGCIWVGGKGLEFSSGVSVWRGWKVGCKKVDGLGSEFRTSSGVSMLNC